MKNIPKPWGGYIVMDDFDSQSVKTKTLFINPKHRLSLQRHEHRTERWIVLEGFGNLQHGKDSNKLESFPLRPGTSYLIEAGDWHRAENHGRNDPLVIFEVQIGSRCDENDIERLEDDYNRIPKETPI